MWVRKIGITFLSFIFITQTHCIVLTNQDLITKMLSLFQGKYRTNQQKPGNIVSQMQNVLCKNFPTVPCDIITADSELQHLILRTVRLNQQEQNDMDMLDKMTIPLNYLLSLLPGKNNEDITKYMKDLYKLKLKMRNHKVAKKSVSTNQFWSHEVHPAEQDTKTSVIKGRKKIRKFYPHKIKYKDKNTRREFGDYSDEKLSMSVEAPPDSHTGVIRKHFSYRNEQPNPSVWRIDYTKHGEPSVNMFAGYNNLKGKIGKTGANLIVDENVLERASRRDVLHPDVYIKNNYARKTEHYNISDA